MRRSWRYLVLSIALIGGSAACRPIPDPHERPGLTDPSALTDYRGPSVITGDTVIENKRVHSRITIQSGDVVIRNSTLVFDDYYHVLVHGGSVRIEHSEFDGLKTTTHADDLGVSGSNVTVRWSTFRGLVNAMRLGDDSTAEHNVISDPNDVYPPAHSDGIEVYGGTNVVIRSNTIDITGGSGETGAVNIATDFGDISNVLVEDNDLTGGTYSLYVRSARGHLVSGVTVKDNRWHTPHIYGTHSVEPREAVAVWSGNALDGRTLEM
jgi:hypothetical protein